MNKKNFLFSLMLTISFLLSTIYSHAAFEDTGTGARGAALGDNYASMGDDVLSLMYNPAELARVHQKEIGTEYSRLYAGLSDGSNISQYYLGYGQPVKWGGTLAFGLKQFSLDNLYKERTLSLGYGEWLTQKIAIGGALKQLYHSFGVPTMIVDDSGNIQSGTPSFFAQNGNANTVYSADLGALYRMTEKHTFGVSVQDVNEPNIALNPADHEVVSRAFRLSMSYAARPRLTLAGSMMTKKSLSSQQDTTWTGSAEKWWKLANADEIAVRGSLASGSRQFQQMGVGSGYRMRSIQLDYAFVFNLTGITPGSTMGTHRFSLAYRFGMIGVPPKSKALPKRRIQPRAADITVKPEGLDRYRPGALPRVVEITITPEDIDNYNPPPRTVDILIDTIFDGDFDGLSDDRDLCPNTPLGLEINSKGCAQSQVDHMGNPLPRKVSVHFLPLEEVKNGR